MLEHSTADYDDHSESDELHAARRRQWSRPLGFPADADEVLEPPDDASDAVTIGGTLTPIAMHLDAESPTPGEVGEIMNLDDESKAIDLDSDGKAIDLDDKSHALAIDLAAMDLDDKSQAPAEVAAIDLADKSQTFAEVDPIVLDGKSQAPAEVAKPIVQRVHTMMFI